MIKRYLILVFLFSTVALFAQKTEITPRENHAYDENFARIHYFNHKIASAYDTNAVKQFIHRQLNLGAFDQLHVVHIAKSLSATHITLQQYHNQVLVLGAQAKVALNLNNELFRCIETVFATHQRLPNVPERMLLEDFFANYTGVDIIENKAAYVYFNNTLVPSWYARFTTGSNGHFDATWFANGAQYFVRDLNNYYHIDNPDSLVAVYVFDPDPISPIGQVYGGIFTDMNDGNEAVLNPLRFLRQVRVRYSNNTFELKNDFVEIREFSNPVFPVVTTTAPLFDFSRSHYGFEQTNVYYHITKYQEHLQSLGYNLVNYAIHADAQGFGGQDNSSFNWGTTPPRLTFGIGGVDDGEDADVIVHEYGHAISHSASPQTNNGTQRSSLDEAIGDYFAVSYKKNDINFGNDKVFNWDGHNTFWQGRTVNNPNNFNYKNITFTSIYTYTTLWNAAMFDIFNQLGKTYTDKLQIEAAYSFASNMTFTQSALTILDADQTMSGGQHQMVIRDAFANRGILEPFSIDENSPHFAHYLLRTNVIAENKYTFLWLSGNGAVEIFDITGRAVYKANLPAGENEILLNALGAGLYVMRIGIENKVYSEKLIVTNP